MNDQDSQIKQLAEALTRLTEFVPASKDELDQWYEQARRLLEDYDLLKGAPHFLWHYLSDADIRMKDEVYAEMQNRQVNSLLEDLKRGVLPPNNDLTISAARGCWNSITGWLRSDS